MQEELKRRAEKQKESGRSYLHFYSEKIVCGTCGKTYLPRMWHPDTTNDPVRACANRNVKSIRYRNPHLYEKGLDELLPMAMQTVLKQRPEIVVVVEEAVSGVIADEERRERAVGYIHRFTEIPASELPLDPADFAIILQRITVRPDGMLTVELLDGAAVRLTALVYGPQRGWMKPPRQIVEGEPVESETEAREHQNHDRNDA